MQVRSEYKLDLICLLLGRKKNYSCLRFPDRPLKKGPTQKILPKKNKFFYTFFFQKSFFGSSFFMEIKE